MVTIFKKERLIILWLLGFLFYSPLGYAFNLLSGTHEARLPVSPDRPEIVFEWDGSTPSSINEKDKFEDGRFAQLEDKEFMRQLLLAAINLWNSVKASYIDIKLEENPAIDLNQSDERYAIAVKSSSNLSTAAFATPRLNDDSDLIIDCDISISHRSVSAVDLAYTLAHELGHCLGLGHNHTNYNALMGYSRVSRSLRLGADDIAGLIYLYPHPDFTSARREFIACASLGAPISKELFWLWLFVFPVAMAALRLMFTRRQE